MYYTSVIEVVKGEENQAKLFLGGIVVCGSTYDEPRPSASGPPAEIGTAHSRSRLGEPDNRITSPAPWDAPPANPA